MFGHPGTLASLTCSLSIADDPDCSTCHAVSASLDCMLLIHTEASLEIADSMCRQITKEPAADGATEAQRAGHFSSNAAKLSLSKPRQPKGIKMPFHQADMSKKCSAAPQSHPPPGLHASQQLTPASADVSHRASSPALQSRAAQQLMQQRQARLQQTTTPSPRTFPKV